ncbi:phage tail tape measure protein [Parapedobacter lycopersici]|uniref:phage tail tape measure protein n=1 Tax=Parapedobacter lycopersici TaxID=1864939 RepID=UPI0033400184
MAKQRTDTESVMKLVINGQQAKTSLKELTDTARKYTTEFRKMREADDPKAYRERREEIKRLNAALKETNDELKAGAGNAKSFSENMKQIAAGVVGGNVLMRAWDMAVQGVGNFIQKNAELSDIMGGVQKTTGLTEAAVDRLNEKFKRFDTRTANTELLGLAQVAGKLGISAERDVEGFVRAADRIGVALGEDLGGVEESINSLGKLTDIFRLKEQYGIEEALMRVGSAINTLGASGTAAEKNLVDFAQRMAGIAPAANISLQDILGLAATADELGQSMESSSTAIGQFIVGLGEDIPKNAKIAKMSVADFSKLLREDANEAFIRVLENSKAADGGLEALAKNMGVLEVSGARGIAALGALAERTDLLRQRQEQGNRAFKDNISVMAEFNNMNTTLGANMEKIWNRLGTFWENSRLRKWFTDLTGALVDNRSESEKLSNEYFAMKGEVDALEGRLQVLVDRHDELKGKGKLNREEQTELSKVITQIAEIVPYAALEFDKYGRVIAVSTEKAREFLETQKAMLSYQNRDAIKAAENDLSDYTEEFDRLNLAMKEGWTRSDSMFGNIRTYKLNDRMRADFTQRIKELGMLKQGAEALIKSLKGEDIELPETGGNNGDSPGTPTNTPATKPDKKAESEREKAKKEYEKLLDAFNALDAARLRDQLSKNQREIAEEQAKYDKLIKEYEAFKKLKGATSEQISDADAKISDLQTKREQATNDMRLRQQEEYLAKIESLRAGLEAKQASELDKEKARINAFYDALERENVGNDDAMAELRIARAKDLTDAEIREAERLKLDKERLEAEYNRNGMTAYDRRLADINVKYDAEIAALKAKYSKQIIATEEFNAALKAIEEGRAYEITQLDEETWNSRLGKAVQAAQIISDAVFQITSNNARSESDMRLEQLRKQREKELSERNLTEAQKKAINKKYDQMERTEKRKAWQAQKRADLAQSLINTALSVGKTFAQFGWPAGIIPAAFAGAAGIAQTAVIAAQKPPQFAKGGMLPVGSSHAQGGIDLMDRRRRVIIGNIEGGEPILSRDTYRNNRAIVDELLYSSQRKAGAAIRLNPDLIDADRAVRNGGRAMLSSGGKPPVVNVAAPAVDMTGVVAAVKQMVDAQLEANRRPLIISSRMLEDWNDRKARITNDVDA